MMRINVRKWRVGLVDGFRSGVLVLVIITAGWVAGLEHTSDLVLGMPDPLLQSHVAAQADVPWYRTPWAMGGYVVGGIGLVLLAVRWRTQTLRRQRRALQRQLNERTEAVQEQKRQLEAYNRELLRTNETLRRTVEEKSQLLGMAAHDLKNPLFGIRALSEILLENKADSEKDTRKLNLIRESADETLYLIDRLLATAAGSAQSSVERREVDLAALTQWSVRSFEPQAERKEQMLRCRIRTDDPCVVEGDKRKLREAIGNLVSNALKYSPRGKTVEVVVDRDPEAVRVSVTDEGPGLSADDVERMFAPFQRLTPQPTGDEGSSGLGLYIVKQIMDLHDGDIEVDTALGQGSTFTLVLPAIAPNANSVPEVEPTPVEMPESSS